MGQQVRKRFLESVAFTANNKQSEDLPRGMIYREMYLRLQGQPTLTAMNNTQANTDPADEWGVVKRIDIIANNTDVIKSISGRELWWLNKKWYGVNPRVTPALGDGATANPSFDSLLILPFWMPQSVRPIDTALDSRELSSLKVEVTWGQYTDINSAASAWTGEPTLEVHSLESFNAKGPFSQWRMYEIEKEITASNPRFQIQLPVGPVYRGFDIVTTDAGVEQNDILNNLKVVSGTTVFLDQPEAVLRMADDIRNGQVRGLDDGASAAFTEDKRSTEANREARYHVDLVTDGFLSEGIATLGFSEFELECDVTVGGGTTKIIVVPHQIIPVRAKA